MGLKIIQLKDDSEFKEIARVGRESFETPLQVTYGLFFPLNGTNESAKEACDQEAAERLALWYHADPTSRWIKIVDETSGRLLGATLWHIFEENPYAAKDILNCTWFPAGEERQIANGLLEQFMVPRGKYMSKPHVFLDIAFTAPNARKQGVMSLLMDWGVNEADKRNLESYLDASFMGRPLYKKFGFIEERQYSLTMEPFPQTEKAREMEKRFTPFTWWPMYRPIRGRFEKGGTSLPWDATA